MKCFMSGGEPLAPCGVLPDDGEGWRLSWLVRKAGEWQKKFKRWIETGYERISFGTASYLGG